MDELPRWPEDAIRRPDEGPRKRDQTACEGCGTTLEYLGDAHGWGHRIQLPDVRPEARVFTVHTSELRQEHCSN